MFPSQPRRAEASRAHIAELNPYTAVDINTSDITAAGADLSFLSSYQVSMATASLACKRGSA